MIPVTRTGLRQAAAALILGAGVGMSPGALSGQAAAFLPDRVALRPLGLTDVLLVVTAPADGGLVLSDEPEVRSPAGVTVTLLPLPAPDTLPRLVGAGSTLTRRLLLRGAPLESEDRLVVSLPVRREGRTESLVATLTVSRGEFLPVSEVATLRVQTGLENLTDRMGDTLFLEVQSKVPFPVAVAPPRGTGPGFLKIKSLQADTIRIEPGSSVLLRMSLKTSRRVRPGAHIVGFTVPLSWSEADAPLRSAELQAFHTVQVGVLGESDILTLLAVPSFFLLPGFLLLSAAAFVLKTGGVEDWIPSDPKTTDFWIVGITFSLLASVVLSEAGMRYLALGYGVADLARVWFASVFLGAGGAGLALWIRKLRVAKAQRDQKAREREAERARQEQAAKMPSRDDDVVATLRKMVQRGDGAAPAELPVVTFAHGGTQARGFELLRVDGEVWVIPEIEYAWTGHRSDKDREAWNQALGETELARVVGLIDGSGPNLRWAERSGFTHPMRVAEGTVSRGAPQRFIQEKV